MHTDEQIISLDAIMERIKAMVKPEFNLVVGIERGGVLPAYLAARWLDVPLKTIRIVFRDDTHKPMWTAPQIQRGMEEDITGMRMLLVDDVGNTGATLHCAAAEFHGSEITTMVISGSADISLFGPHNRCICWPWNHNPE